MLEIGRVLMGEGVIILNPENLNPQSLDDIDMDWFNEVRAHRRKIEGTVQNLRRAKLKAEAEARRNAH